MEFEVAKTVELTITLSSPSQYVNQANRRPPVASSQKRNLECNKVSAKTFSSPPKPNEMMKNIIHRPVLKHNVDKPVTTAVSSLPILPPFAFNLGFEHC